MQGSYRDSIKFMIDDPLKVQGSIGVPWFPGFLLQGARIYIYGVYGFGHVVWRR